MPAPASRRWLLAAVALAGLVAAALWLKSHQRAQAERSAPSATGSAGDMSRQGLFPEAPNAEPAPSLAPEKAWRLEVEIRDENDEPISGRIYITDAKGDLLVARDTEPPALLVESVHGTVGVIAYVLDYIPQFFDNMTPPASDVGALVIRLERGAGISGKVVDESGRPVRARVSAEPLDSPWLLRKSESWRVYAGERGQWFSFRSSTGDDGSFRVEGLPPGRYEIGCALSQIRPEGATALLEPEPVVACAGDRDVRIVCRRAVEVRVRFIDEATGELLPSDALATWEAKDCDRNWSMSGSGGVDPDGLPYEVAPGTSFRFSADVEGYLSPEPQVITADNEPGVQQVPMRFRLDPGGMAEIDLVVRDDAGVPASELLVGHGKHWQRRYSEDGRYLLRIPAGHQRIGLASPRAELRRFKREWMVLADERREFRPTRVYLPQDIDIDLPRGGHVAREITMQRAALIWIRHEPETDIDARLLRDETEVKDALEVLYQSMGLVAAVEPGTYIVDGRIGEKRVSLPVEAKAGEVAEVWLGVNGAK